MTQAPIYTQDGTKRGMIDLPEHLFTLPWADALVHQVAVGLAHNRRSGTAHTKGAADVSGGGRKPWRQKGTGRARHGSIRSPLWVGGGVTFGPNVQKNYSVVISRKMRAKAFFTVLSEKLRADSLVFLDSFTVDKPSTKSAAACVAALCGSERKKHLCTVVFSESDFSVRKSFANLAGVKTVALDALNTQDVLAARKLIFVGPERSVEALAARGGVVSPRPAETEA